MSWHSSVYLDFVENVDSWLAGTRHCDCEDCVAPYESAVPDWPGEESRLRPAFILHEDVYGELLWIRKDSERECEWYFLEAREPHRIRGTDISELILDENLIQKIKKAWGSAQSAGFRAGRRADRAHTKLCHATKFIFDTNGSVARDE